jgi:DNA-binding NtrC family response regulator
MANTKTTAKTLQVVVVDDEPQITDLLKAFLLCISKDLDIYTFNDPEEARAHLLQNSIDVLITDFKMPKYDGIQLMKLMPKDSTKILISGFVSEITENQLLQINASFLEKPVSMKDLDTLIRKAEARKT